MAWYDGERVTYFSWAESWPQMRFNVFQAYNFSSETRIKVKVKNFSHALSNKCIVFCIYRLQMHYSIWESL